MIASVTYDMGAGIVKKKDALSYVLMVGAFIASRIFEVNVVYVILICGIVGVIRALIEKKITGKEVKRNDLFEIIFKLSSDWTVQLWWRLLCGDASDPRTGCDTAWVGLR